MVFGKIRDNYKYKLEQYEVINIIYKIKFC